MTVKSVREAIRSARVETCGKINAPAAIKIVKAAQDGIVYPTERKLIEDFFQSRGAAPSPGQNITLACPEGTQPTFDDGAERVMNKFLYNE